MNITYQPTGINNFHNSSAMTLRISGKTDDFDGPVYLISKSQAERISRHFCGIADCLCAHGAAIPLNEAATEFGVRTCYAK